MVVFSMDADGVVRRSEEILNVIAQAYGGTPDSFRSGLESNLKMDEFRLVGGSEKGTGKLMGVAYGHRCQPSDGLSKMLAQILPEDQLRSWLSDTFQVVELAVLPEHQFCGVGVRLLNTLLANVNEQIALLPVPREGVARKLCERHGWQIVVPAICPRTPGPEFTLMGRRSDPDSSEIWEH